MKSFGSNFHRVITYIIMAFTRIHVIIRSRVWRERISHNKERNGDKKSLAESWPDFVQKPIDKRKSGNVGCLLSSRQRINPWFTIVQSLFILTLSRETIDSTRFNSRVPTHYALSRIHVVMCSSYFRICISRFIISRPTCIPLWIESVNIEANIDLQIWEVE